MLELWFDFGVQLRMVRDFGVCQFESNPHPANELFETASPGRRPPRYFELCHDHAALVQLALRPPNNQRLDVMVRQRDGGWDIRVDERGAQVGRSVRAMP